MKIVLPTSSNMQSGMSVTGNAGAIMAQSFARQLKKELANINLTTAIGTGVSS